MTHLQIEMENENIPPNTGSYILRRHLVHKYDWDVPDTAVVWLFTKVRPKVNITMSITKSNIDRNGCIGLVLGLRILKGKNHLQHPSSLSQVCLSLLALMWEMGEIFSSAIHEYRLLPDCHSVKTQNQTASSPRTTCPRHYT